MKKILLLFSCLAALNATALQDIPIASANRATGITVDSEDQVSRTFDKTLHVVLTPTVVTGTPTAVISVDAKSPQGDYYNIISSAAITMVANTLLFLKVGVGLTAVANSTANDMVPPVYRIRVVVGGGVGTAATFSVGRNIN